MWTLMLIFTLTLGPDYHVLISQGVEGFKSKEDCATFGQMAVSKIGSENVVMAVCKEFKTA